MRLVSHVLFIFFLFTFLLLSTALTAGNDLLVPRPCLFERIRIWRRIRLALIQHGRSEEKYHGRTRKVNKASVPKKLCPQILILSKRKTGVQDRVDPIRGSARAIPPPHMRVTVRAHLRVHGAHARFMARADSRACYFALPTLVHVYRSKRDGRSLRRFYHCLERVRAR